MTRPQEGVNFGVGANQGVGPLDFVIDGFADIMEQPHTTGHFLVQIEFRRHDPRQKADLDAVLQNILGIGRSELKLAQVPDQIIVEVMHPKFEGRLFTGFLDGLLDFLGDFFNHIFNPGRVDATIGNQTHERQAGNFASYRIETR